MEIITKEKANMVFRHNGYLQEFNKTELAKAGMLVYRKADTVIPVKYVSYDAKTNNCYVQLEMDGSYWYVSSRTVLFDGLVQYVPKPKDKFLSEFLPTLNAALVEDGREEYQIADRSELSAIEDALKELLEIKLNVNQFTALVSFAYEHGLDSLARSSLLKKVNRGEFLSAAKDFGRWTKREGRIVRSKVTLRQKEKALFLMEVEE